MKLLKPKNNKNVSIENPIYFTAGDPDGGPDKNKNADKISEDKIKEQTEQFLAEQLPQDTEFFSRTLEPQEFRVWQERNQKDFISLPEEKQNVLMKILGANLGEVSKKIEEYKNNPQNISKEELKYLQNYRTAIINRLQSYHLVYHLNPDKQKQYKEPIKKTIELNPNEINPENIEDVINEKLNTLNTEKDKQLEQTPEPQQPSPNQPDKQPEKLEIRNQLFSLLGNAEKILNSKEIEPKEQVELLKGYSEQIAKLLHIPTTGIYLAELIKDNKKIELLLNNIPGLKQKEGSITKPEAIKQAKDFIQKEEKKGKESIFQKMGGWGTIGGVVGFSLLMFLILIFLGEFKLLEKATDIDLEGGGKKK